MNVIGIDPGKKGAIVLLKDDGTTQICKMPEVFQDIFNLLFDFVRCETDLVAYLEDVGQGIPGQSSSATATFARHNGHLEMALYAVGIPTIKVRPQKWQKFYSNTIGTSKNKEKREWKNILKSEAMRRFPNEKVTLDTADALLIAVYGHNQVNNGK